MLRFICFIFVVALFFICFIVALYLLVQEEEE
jgi:hypothetical protein